MIGIILMLLYIRKKEVKSYGGLWNEPSIIISMNN